MSDTLTGSVETDLGGAQAHPVDERIAPARLLILAIQHLLTMYAGAVTVPLIIGAALHLSTADTAYLVSSDLLACGLVTIVQCIGVGAVGVRLPVMMGVTFVALGPAVAIASNPSLGLPGVFGATIVSGLFGVLIAPIFSRLSRLFAPVVTGTTMVLIGVSLVNVAVTWTAGGSAGGAGDLKGMAIAALVVAIILGVIRFAKGFLANTAVLIGIVSGFIVTCVAGQVDFSHVASAHWLMVVSPFHFGLPKFDVLAAVTMTVVMLVTMVETSGMLFVLSRIVERPLTSKALARGLRGDAVGAIVGGVFNSLPYTSYSQNVAIVGMTGVRSRYVCAAAGVLLILLAALPKLSFLVTAIPFPVLGGAALIMFGMVAANGIRTLAEIDFSANKKSLYVVALALSIGLIPTADPKFFDGFPPDVAGFLRNGVLLGVVTSVLLNLLLNRERAERGGMIAYPKDCTFTPGDWAILSRRWFPVAVAAEVTGVASARLLDIDLVVFRAGAGEITVATDRCPHRGMALSRGWTTEGQLICPYHGLHFDGGGRCVAVPSDPGAAIPDSLRLTVLPSVEAFGLVWASLAGETPDLPTFEAWSDDAFQNIVCPTLAIAASPGRQIEGFLDVAHFAWAHGTTFGDRTNPVVPDFAIERTETGVRARYVSGVSNYGPSQRDLAPADFEWRRTFEVYPPFAARLVVDYPDDRQLWILNVASPVSARQTRLFCSLARNFDLETPVEEVRAFNLRVFNEDRVLVENQRPLDLPLDGAGEGHIAADRTSIAYRRVLKRMGLTLGYNR